MEENPLFWPEKGDIEEIIKNSQFYYQHLPVEKRFHK